MILRGDKFVVTGAAGFIGSHIAEHIVRQGRDVVCVDDFSTGSMDNLKGWWDKKHCTLIPEDVRNIEQFKDELWGASVIFHEAASKCTICTKDPQRDLDVNALGSLRVFQVAAEIGARVVHASTGSINGGNPKSFYGVSKQAGESYLGAVKEYSPDFRFESIRYHHVFGPRQNSSDEGGVVAIFIKKMLKDEPITIFGDGEQLRHFTYVGDVVDANFQSANRCDCRTYSLAEHKAVTINTLASCLAKLIGKDVVINYAPERRGDIRRFDVSDAVSPDGDFILNLSSTVHWYASQT